MDFFLLITVLYESWIRCCYVVSNPNFEVYKVVVVYENLFTLKILKHCV